MNVECTHCHSRNIMDDSVAGKIVDCPTCNEPFRVKVSDDARRLCPNCSAELGDDSVICLQCGYNYDTGESLRTIVSQEKEKLPLWHKCLNLVADTVPGLFKPRILMAAILCFALSLFLLYFGLLLLIGLKVVLSGTMLTAFALITYAQSVSLMLSGTFERMSRAMGDFESVHWWIFCTLVFGPFLAILLFFVYVGPKLTS